MLLPESAAEDLKSVEIDIATARKNRLVRYQAIIDKAKAGQNNISVDERILAHGPGYL